MRALVTGATSGIGLAIAAELALRGTDLVIVARDKNRLDSVAARLANYSGVTVEPLAADLLDEAGIAAVISRLQDADSVVDVLVNNAGIGLPPGGFLGNDIETSRRLTSLNVDAVMRLSHAALPAMIRRGRGGLLTVASIAAFTAGTPAITYSASKAWAVAFGEGLNTLLRSTGVHSTVVAPGFVRSEFHSRSGVATTGIPESLWLTPEQVAVSAVDAFARNTPLVVPGAIWRTGFAIGSRLPRPWLRAGFAALMSRTSSPRAGSPTAAPSIQTEGTE